MITLDQARDRIGGKVIYRPRRSGFEAVTDEQRRNDWHREQPAEEGVITSVNGSYVFVRYGSQVTPAATYPADLEFLAPGGTP